MTLRSRGRDARDLTVKKHHRRVAQALLSFAVSTPVTFWRRSERRVGEFFASPVKMRRTDSFTATCDGAADPDFTAELDTCRQVQRADLSAPGWFASPYGDSAFKGVSYMKFDCFPDQSRIMR